MCTILHLIVYNCIVLHFYNSMCLHLYMITYLDVYIYKCNGVTFDIKGKSNNIIVDTCNKSNIVFDTVISSCEVVNCKRIQTQVRGICPSFSVDSTDGFLTYLSKESVEVTTFMTCKSCEMNGKFHYRMIIFYKHIVTFVVRLNYFLYFMTKNSELSR